MFKGLLVQPLVASTALVDDSVELLGRVAVGATAAPSAHSGPQSGHGPQARPEFELNWPVIIWIGLLHLGVLAAPWTFTWSGLMVMVVWHWLTGSIGICLGYHRLLTHSSFATYRPIRYLLAWIGGLSGQGSALDWVADHRRHHAFSDQEGDPHSPHDGSMWSHMWWLFWREKGIDQAARVRHWAPDLAKDPGLQFLNRTFILWHFVLGLAMAAIGYAFGGWQLATSLVVWGMFVRLVAMFHSTWFVNSASHMWGYRNYETTDDSRNNWWVAILAYGEGWHNNHHAYPRMAAHGHRWWEFDVTYRALRVLYRLGLAWNIVDYKSKSKIAQ